MSTESSGGSCNYYVAEIECPQHLEPYAAECGDIIDQLQLTPNEANIFKEIWRSASARQGKKKAGNNPIRSVEKIKFYAERLYQLTMHRYSK